MKNFNITLISKEQQKTIFCREDEFILDAAEKNKIELPYSCRSGACSSCTAKLLEGQICQENQIFLDQKQIKDGFFLTCVANPLSDIIVLTHQEEHLYEN